MQRLPPPKPGSPRSSSVKAKVGRKLVKKRKEHPGRLSMDLPARFKQEDEEHDDGADAAQSVQIGQASLYGMFAASQSKSTLKTRWQPESPEDSETEESNTRKSQDVSQPASERSSKRPSVDERQRVVASLEVGKGHRKRLSENKLLKPFMKPIRERSQSQGQDQMTQSQFLPPKAELPEVLERPSSTGIRSDAPILDRKLQAQAKAERESPSLASSIRKNKDDEDVRRPKAAVPLPEALAEIFRFDEPEDVISEYPCWYLQSVLLQGYMYITQRHVCFYAYLQKRGNTVHKSGHIAKRGKQNPRYHRYWFVLKGDVLSYYASAADPYFPNGSIDLRYGISAEVVPEKGQSEKEASAFTISTDRRTYYFRADSAISAKEWVRQLRKVIFRSHNDGDSVKISLPLENVVDVEQNQIVDFAETVKISVIDGNETFCVEEYFFTFFSFGSDAMNVLKIMTAENEARRLIDANDGEEALIPTPLRSMSIGKKSPRLSQSPAPLVHENIRSTLTPLSATARSSPRPSAEYTRSSFDATRLSLDRGRSSFDRGRRSISGARQMSLSKSRLAKSPFPPSAQESTDSFATASDQPSSPAPGGSQEIDMSASQFLGGDGGFGSPTLRMPQPKRTISGSTVDRLRRESQDQSRSPSTPASERVRVQPPSRTQTDQTLSDSRPSFDQRNSDQIRKHDSKLQPSDSMLTSKQSRPIATPFQHAATLAGYVRDQGKRMSSYLSGSPKEYYGKFSGAIAGGKRHYSEADGLAPEDRIDDPEDELEVAEHERRFQQHFALPETERLSAVFYASLHRVLPLYGKIYLGTRWFCFRSLLYGTRTKIIIPLKDIHNVAKQNAFRLGYPGMVLVIRGHEELFFDFRSSGLRDDCVVTILRSLDKIAAIKESFLQTDGEKLDADAAAAENELLHEARIDGYAEHDLKLPQNIDLTEIGEPPVIFDDPDASVLDFKPKKSLRVTCLTIGSRGDVQPYIALCKGLLAEGHQPKIATHAEFEGWIRKHGIDFAPVEGSPAELMRICVEFGMFTPAFITETNAKFRPWLDTLLITAWEACQNTDLLIESPSAMAGIHIAEALGVPYFRAFTMPWTRTRAYPHAFAVMNRKMGGAYNIFTYSLFDTMFWQLTQNQINRWRRKTLGIRDTTLTKLQPNKVPFLYNFSPSVVIPPLDFSDWIKVTGYWFLDEASDWVPPEDLVAFIKQAREDSMKLVYIGFGSVVVNDSRVMTQHIIDAVTKADVRCILSKGWSDRLEKNTAGLPEVPLPPSIFQITSAPHDWLFKQIDAAVHHGGAGTTGASLRAGVPTIIKPFFGDQFFFATRVEDLGVGMHIKRLTENTLGKALWIATHDDRMRTKARVIGEEIRGEDGVKTAIDAIYRNMEYASTLIKVKDQNPIEGAPEDEDTEESWTFIENDSDAELSGVKRSDSVGWVNQHRSSGHGHGRQMSLGSMVLRGKTA